MPLTLSKPVIDDASIDMPELIAPAKDGRRIQTFPQFETEGPTAIASKIGAQSLGSRQVLPELSILGESTLGEQSPLSGKHDSGRIRVVGVPKLEWPSGQDPILTDIVRRLLRTLYVIVVSRALQVGFPLRGTIVSVFQDPTEQERKAVLRLACNANVTQALAFWDSLETDLQSWLERLSEYERTTFITKLGLRVHWR